MRREQRDGGGWRVEVIGLVTMALTRNHTTPHHTTPYHTEWYQVGESSPQPPYQSQRTSTFIHINTTSHIPPSWCDFVLLCFSDSHLPHHFSHPHDPYPTLSTLTPPLHPVASPPPSLPLSLHCIHDHQTQHVRYSWPRGQHPLVPGSRGSLPCHRMLPSSMACFHTTPLTHHRRGEGGEKRRRREGEAGEVSGVGMVVNGSRINGYDQRII